jgi:hypothetical protein
MGPRAEVDPYVGRWECVGSHFAGGEPDCVRRHGGNPEHGVLDHRLSARDADLGLPGAQYFYEMYFVTEGDADRLDNLGSRPCAMQWIASQWSFSTPPGAMELGPALSRWGGTQTWATLPGDGSVLLASKAIDLGGGRTRFEYALFNLDSERRVRKISVPVGAAALEGMGFHDPDADASNDWSVALVDGVLSWETDPAHVDPDANALLYGWLFNFWFESDSPAGAAAVTLEAWESTGDDEVTALAQVPSTPAHAPDPAGERLAFTVSPNPLNSTTVLSFVLEESAPVSLGIFDATGRAVRSLASGVVEAGTYDIAWDGRDDSGRAAAAGVYYARLAAGVVVSVRSLTVLP